MQPSPQKYPSTQHQTTTFWWWNSYISSLKNSGAGSPPFTSWNPIAPVTIYAPEDIMETTPVWLASHASTTATDVRMEISALPATKPLISDRSTMAHRGVILLTDTTTREPPRPLFVYLLVCFALRPVPALHVWMDTTFQELLAFPATPTALCATRHWFALAAIQATTSILQLTPALAFVVMEC